MSSGSNKNLLIALGAGVAVVAGAVILHLINSKAEGSAAQTQKVLEEIDALGPPKKEMNGLLNFGYYKDVFFIIQKHAKLTFAAEKSEMLAKRRSLLKENKMGEYKELVKEMIQKEEKLCGDLLQDAMEHIGLNEQEFMQMH